MSAVNVALRYFYSGLNFQTQKLWSRFMHNKIAPFLSCRLAVFFPFCTCFLSCLYKSVSVLVHISKGLHLAVRRAVPLMVAVVANYTPRHTITIIHVFQDRWTHTCYPPYSSQCSKTPIGAHTYVHAHECTQSLSELFPTIFWRKYSHSDSGIWPSYSLAIICLSIRGNYHSGFSATSNILTQFYHLWSKSCLSHVKYALYTKKK